MKIIEVRHTGDGMIRLWCVDQYDHSGETKTGIRDEAHVWIDVAGDVPSIGDDVWWQGHKVFWTPADRHFTDRPLRKIGYSLSV